MKILLKLKSKGSLKKMKTDKKLPWKLLLPPKFTIQRLAETFRHIKSAMEIFETDDPNFESSLKALEAMKNAYACYREIYHEKKKASSVQTSLDSYFKKPEPMQKSPHKATIVTEPSEVSIAPPPPPSNLVRRLNFEDSDDPAPSQ
jgi:hypothetical protein